MNWHPIIDSLFVAGEPKGQPRARAFAKVFGNGKASARMYDPGKEAK